MTKVLVSISLNVVVEFVIIILFVDIVDIKPANMEELTEVITAAEFHPNHCNYLVYSSSKGILRLCDMRAAALCDRHAKSKLTILFTSTTSVMVVVNHGFICSI